MELIDRKEVREKAALKRARGNVPSKKGRVISLEERKTRHERAQNTPELDKMLSYSTKKN